MSDKQQFGEWKVKDRLAEGTDGKCFLVHKENSDKLYVLKQPQRKFEVCPFTIKKKKRLKNEAAALKKLNHPNIQKLVDSNTESDTPYIVTEHYSNGSLNEHNFSRWDIDRKIKVFDGICHGMRYIIEQNIVIGSATILLREDWTPVIGDFGGCQMDATKEEFELMKAAQMRSVAYIFYSLIEGKRPLRKLQWAISDTKTEIERADRLDELAEETPWPEGYHPTEPLFTG